MKLFFLTWILFFLSLSVNAQSITGEIKYGIRNSFEFTKDTINLATKILDDSSKIMEDLTFLLTFNREEALYSYEDYLGLENQALAQRMAAKLAGKGTYYINTKTKVKVKAKDFLGDKFLITYPLTQTNWKISKSNKKIGKYNCLKATLLLKKDELNLKDRLIEAWFTTGIPISYGPKNYGGLPGMILELQEGKITYYAKQISLNKKVSINAPKKGRKITDKKFSEYVIQKSKEYGFIK